MPRPNPEGMQRSRAFARVLGPFVAAATLIVAIRLPDLGGVVDGLFAHPVLPWILGATMLLGGLIVTAFHQYWYSLTAALISLFGWFVALRGLALMALPSAMHTGAGETLDHPGLVLLARVFFLLLTVLGLWLTYVGWISRAQRMTAASTGPRCATRIAPDEPV